MFATLLILLSMTSSTLSCGIDLDGDGKKWSLGIFKALGMCEDKFNYTGNCAGWRAIKPSRLDTLTAGTKQQILEHNLYGVEIGCWVKPAPKKSEEATAEPRQP